MKSNNLQAAAAAIVLSLLSCAWPAIPFVGGPHTYGAIVSATKGWQDSRVSAQQGDQVKIEVVGGQWTQISGAAPYNNGTGNLAYVCSDHMPSIQCVEPLPNAPQGALLGMIGSDVFEVGPGKTITAQQSGNLYFRMNDGDVGLYDNAGSLSLRISILR